jgi:hypothetical protein
MARKGTRQACTHVTLVYLATATVPKFKINVTSLQALPGARNRAVSSHQARSYHFSGVGRCCVRGSLIEPGLFVSVALMPGSAPFLQS